MAMPRSSRFLLLCLVVPGAVFGQSGRGTFTGAVLDPAGAVVPGAVVVATHTESGSKYETVTTATGNYTVAQVPAGTYDLSVEVSGFSKCIQRGIRISATQPARIHVTLQVGATAAP